MNDKLVGVYQAYRLDPAFDELRTQTRFVPGDGNSLEPNLIFIGEAPGAEEERLGRPFVGPAGKVLDGLFDRVGIDRDSQFITNLVKYRPPNNRFDVVTAPALKRSIFYLVQEIDAVDPARVALVALVGSRALRAVFPDRYIGGCHGQLLVKGDRRFFPLYHPAMACYRDFDPALLREMEKDLRGILDYSANQQLPWPS